MGDGDIGQMHVDNILPANILPHLPHCLKEELIFDIPYCSAYFHYHQISRFFLGDFINVVLNDIGNMGNVLNGLSQVVPSSLFFSYHVKYLAHGQVPLGLAPDTQESLVVPKIHIHFPPVIEDKYLPVLKWIHCSRINIEVAVTFDRDDLQPRGKKVVYGGSSNSFPQPGKNAAGYDDVFGGRHFVFSAESKEKFIEYYQCGQVK